MVDFKKHLAGTKAEKPTDPVKLYDTLDRAHDKGPLRPAQLAVLGDWFANHQSTRDIIVKLHTGQGKTLIGLLMLQSRLNGKHGPVVYLCPDNYLIAQTCDQAKQFGITTCIADPELPNEFTNGDTILVTSVHKLFNGLTKFGLNRQSVSIGTLLMDDAHACTDTIREQCRIRIPSEEPAYSALKTLFADDLEMQGVGTYADICNGKRDTFLPVPYWSWAAREAEIANILSKNASRDSIKFAWPLLKDILGHCQGIISGAAIEIEPYIAPLAAFGSYWKASHRIFMSATVTDDAFLVKGLQLSPEAILHPSRFGGRHEVFEEYRTSVNYQLSFYGLAIDEKGQPQRVAAARTISEATQRANELRSELTHRSVHVDVLRFCKAELLQDNYFHCVLEATKSVAQKIRDKAGIDGDGTSLVDQAFSIKTPLLALNTLQSDSEQSEQKGFANLLKGVFGTFRNVLAHTPKITWAFNRIDAMDALTILSYIHRRLDEATVVTPTLPRARGD